MEVQSAQFAAMAEIVAAESEEGLLLPAGRRQSDYSGDLKEEERSRIAVSLENVGETESLRGLVRCLYWSHFLSRWGDR